MNKFFIIVSFVTIPFLNYAQKSFNLQLNTETDSIIKSLLDEINADSIHSYMQWLEDMETRWAFSSNRLQVAEQIVNKFKSFGYTQVELEPYNFYFGDYSNYIDQYNVVCKKPGNSEKIIVIGAHHDAVQNSPGADDNGSGTAGLLELARVFHKKNIPTNHTLKFITFSAEEEGLIGSKYSANESYFMNEDIALMINMDMISNASSDSLSQVGINYKENEGFLGKLVNSTSDNYTGMTPVYFGYPSNSDHFSYGTKGYSVIYFEEFEFSPVYHSPNDLVIHTNPTYASRVLKTVASTLLSFDVIPELPEINISNTGNGTSIKIQSDLSTDFSKYEFFYSNDNINYILHDGATENTTTVDNLLPQTNYQFILNFHDNNENIIPSEVFHFYTDSLPSHPQNLNLFGFDNSIEAYWDAGSEDDLLGYNIYEYHSESSSVKLNTNLINHTQFSVTGINDNNFHYYYITTEDINGNESNPSEIKGSKLGKDAFLEDSLDLLVVLDLVATPIYQPQIENFFNSILNEFEYKILAFNNATEIDQSILNNSKIILWVAPNLKVNNSLLNANYNEIIKYLNQGGKLILNSPESNIATSFYKRALPSFIPENHNAYTYFKTSKVDLITDSWFSGAKGESNDYPNLDLDTPAIPQSLLTNSYLDWIQSIQPTADANVIYSYQSPNPDDINHGKMHGMPIGIEYIGNDFDLVFLSLPIYYMMENQSRDLISHILNNRFINTTTEIGEPITSTPIKLDIWPQPSKDYINIESEKTGELFIYNAFGKLVKSKTLNTERFIRINISNFHSGIYYCSLKNSSGIITKKIIIQ